MCTAFPGVWIHAGSGTCQCRLTRYRTRYECPVSLATWVRDGYFQTRIWFCE